MMDAKELSETVNPYSELLLGLDKTTCHSIKKLPHPKDKIKQAILQFATTVQDENVLVDLGMMFAYLGLFIPDAELANRTQQARKDIAAKQIVTLHQEFVEYVETHNPYCKA
jgi:hypothetical protein